ncbi:cation diffusion facilitator family transporter [Legionella sp. W05-934-2]|uniref:cation diffusion facilitator family transporter n=1 Tax=Legionella sp. W05-934-2 TaxID=1198649 RepID=UPI0034633E8A
MSHSDRYIQARRATLIGAVTNLLLAVMKTIGGVVFYSHALVADGIHSFADLLTDLLVLFASKFGSEEADSQHPYGHQRIETAATFMLSVFLMIAGGAIGWDAIEALFHVGKSPDKIAIIIAIISILANEGLFQYTKLIGTRIQSELLIVNAWHHRSDSLSSLVVAVGLMGVWLGFYHLDAVAAIVVAWMIIKMGWDYSWNSVKELIDTAVDDETIRQIEDKITAVHGVKKMHQLRTRSMGGDVYIDVHVQVSPMISVSEGHHIAQNVHRSLLLSIEKVKDVTVHIDPEDDEEVCPSFHLPSRDILEKSIFSDLKKQFSAIDNIVIHYIDGDIFIDIFVKNEAIDMIQLEKAVVSKCQAYAEIKKIQVLQCISKIAN